MTQPSLHINFLLRYLENIHINADITDIERFAQALEFDDVLAAIKKRNPELKNLAYRGDRAFQGEFSIHPAHLRPFTVGEFKEEKFLYDFAVESALGTLLERIFWLPPHPPRISGRFTHTIEKYTLNGRVYNALPKNHGGGGGIRGGI